MALKINGMESKPIQANETPAVSRVTHATSGDAAAEGAKSGVEITGAARQLAALEQEVRDMPEIDEARVARLRAALERGDYEVDARAVADKLLRFERDLASLTSSGNA